MNNLFAQITYELLEGYLLGLVAGVALATLFSLMDN